MSGSISLGLHATTASIDPTKVLSTAPASPSEEEPALIHNKSIQHMDNSATSKSVTAAPLTMSPDPSQHATAAHFSFGPATQQTVTTVTTTTTVSFPPLIIKPPRDLLDRDLKQYPLAYLPTPEHLKKFCTDFHGRPVRFHEEEDAQETLRRYRELQAQIQRHNGVVRTDETKLDYRTPLRHAPGGITTKHNVSASNAHKRATPPSIAEAAELASLHRKAKRARSQSYRNHLELTDLPSLPRQMSIDPASSLRNPAPATPDTDAGTLELLPPPHGMSSRSGLMMMRKNYTHSRLRDSLDDQDLDAEMADSESQESDPHMPPPLYDSRGESKRSRTPDASTSSTSHDRNVTATARVADIGFDREALQDDRRRPELPSIVTSSQHDASLPSPSLSPITAAANLASRRNTFDTSFGEAIPEDDSTVSGFDLEEDEKPSSAESSATLESGKFGASNVPTESSQTSTGNTSAAPTVMDLPTMVEAFDSIPQAMQSYLIYQFLRRCSKATLQMVASVVNPALKCDPFSVLPPELGLNITRFLDYRSMCRAAQVSKRWRRLINSDEKAWRDLLERDEFVLPEGEIARAVREGWGWQYPGADSYEIDLSRRSSRDGQDSGAGSPIIGAVVTDDEETASSAATTRTRRKLNAKSGSSSKRLKRRFNHAHPTVQSTSSSSTSPSAISSARLSRIVATAQGPNCLANEAAHAVPHPAVGLPSLESMHLFKSLYQRHFLIRKAWMSGNSQPQHLAFRAHHHHVVTCLLFDDDKILTGSDDAKINVYDTKTGALRNRLEGHEGGVWALQYDGNTLVSGSTDRSVRVWDIKSGRCLQVLQGHTSTVRCLLILKPVQVGTAADGSPIMMPKEPLIITGSRDSTLRIWKVPQAGDRTVFQAGPAANDRDNPYFVRTLTGHHNSVRAIAAHGDTLISGSYDCSLRVWKISTGDVIHRLQGHAQKVYSVVLDHERNRCISGSMDNLVKVWDLQTGTCLFNLEGHSSLVGLLDLGHDRLVSAAADSTLRIWDPESGSCKATLSAHTGAITCFQHDGQKVISGSDRTLKMWNVRTGECIKDLLTDLTGVWQVRFDQRRCVAAVQRNGLTYIELLDFGAVRDGVPADRRGRRILVDARGREVEDVIGPSVEVADAPAV